jgi:transcriptional regulator with GAF, ATPase, and Fis domain
LAREGFSGKTVNMPSDPDPGTSTQHLATRGQAGACASFALAIVDGPDRGLTFTIDGTQPSRLFMGTSPACELRLSDPAVSRRHLAFDAEGTGLRITDLGSTNKTHVGDLEVREARLAGGETLRLGTTRVKVTRTDETKSRVLDGADAFGPLLGASDAMRRLYPLCRRLAGADVPAILEGETGTGKEVLAEALHEEGPRAGGPFVVFDCTATPENLLESALFGHEKGAFTGAVAARAGVFEQAHGGTLLIDEIGDLPLALQPKLLRVVQRREVQRIGSSKWTKVDTRILAATRRDLDREVQAGRFRDDLFFRLHVARVELPPLRDRKGDVSLLARTFWRSMGGQEDAMPPGLLVRFEDYAWPGNVRELYNTVARFLALGDFAQFDTRAANVTPTPGDAARDAIAEVVALELPLSVSRQRIVDEFERRYIEHMLARHGGNLTKAAAASGVALRYLRLLKARHT